MKTLTLVVMLSLCLFALTPALSAQETLNFSNLPLLKSPSPVPAGYGRLDWANFFYVDPYGWSGAGLGYKLGAEDEDVVFVGGAFCRLSGYACFGTLSNPRGFVLLSATVAGGFGPTPITVTAYNNGRYLGSANYLVTTEMRTLNFPTAWGVATQIVIQVNGHAGDLVLYQLSAYTLGG
jgi:hypothetical protein